MAWGGTKVWVRCLFFMLSDFFRHGKRYVIENVFIAFINRTSLGKYFIYMCI